jgi:hypothetical protein
MALHRAPIPLCVINAEAWLLDEERKMGGNTVVSNNQYGTQAKREVQFF